MIHDAFLQIFLYVYFFQTYLEATQFFCEHKIYHEFEI